MRCRFFHLLSNFGCLVRKPLRGFTCGILELVQIYVYYSVLGATRKPNNIPNIFIGY